MLSLNKIVASRLDWNHTQAELFYFFGNDGRIYPTLSKEFESRNEWRSLPPVEEMEGHSLPTGITDDDERKAQDMLYDMATKGPDLDQCPLCNDGRIMMGSSFKSRGDPITGFRCESCELLFYMKNRKIKRKIKEEKFPFITLTDNPEESQRLLWSL